MPDGEKITMKDELWKCSELLFNPTSFSMEASGLAKMCLKSIKRSDMDARKELYENIIPIGGSTLFEGFIDRLKNDLQNIIPSCINAQVQDQSDRTITPWIGAYMITINEAFSKLAIDKEDYKERGTNIVSRFTLY